MIELLLKDQVLNELYVIQDRPVSTAMKIIWQLPTLDIVRCGECKQLDHTKWCDFFLHYMNDDDFCSYGERRILNEHTDKRD